MLTLNGCTIRQQHHPKERSSNMWSWMRLRVQTTAVCLATDSWLVSLMTMVELLLHNDDSQVYNLNLCVSFEFQLGTYIVLWHRCLSFTPTTLPSVTLLSPAYCCLGTWHHFDPVRHLRHLECHCKASFTITYLIESVRTPSVHIKLLHFSLPLWLSYQLSYYHLLIRLQLQLLNCSPLSLRQAHCTVSRLNFSKHKCSSVF